MVMENDPFREAGVLDSHIYFMTLGKRVLAHRKAGSLNHFPKTGPSVPLTT